MADEATSGASAPASTGSAGAPAASSTPAAAPATPSTPTTPATSIEATPVSHKEGRPPRNEGEAALEYLQRVRKHEEEKTGADPKSAEPAKPAVDPAAPPAAEAPKPGEATTEETPAEGDDDDFILDPATPVGVKDLAEKLTSNPQLQEALVAAGVEPEQLYETARLAGTAAKFLTEFPDIESAQHAKQQSVAFGALDDAFSSISDRDTAAKFVSDMLMPLSYVLDAEGKPKVNAQGFYETDGTVFNFLDHVSSINLDYDYDHAKKVGDEETMAAVDRLRAFRKAGGAPGNEEDVPEDVKQERARNETERQRLDTERRQGAQERHEEFETQVRNTSSTDIDDMITKLVLDQTDMSDFMKQTCRQKIRAELFKRMAGDGLYLSRKEDLGRRERGPEVLKQRIALNKGTAKSMLRSVAAPVLKEAGAQIKKRSESRAGKFATQSRTNKMEPVGGTAAASPSGKLDNKALVEKVRADYRKQHGENPDNVTLLGLVRQIRQSA